MSVESVSSKYCEMRGSFWRFPGVSERTETVIKECGFQNYPTLESKELKANVQQLKKLEQEGAVVIVAVMVAAVAITILTLLLITSPELLGALIPAYAAFGFFSGCGAGLSGRLSELDSQAELKKYFNNSFAYYRNHGEGLERAIRHEITKKQVSNQGFYSLEELQVAQKEIQNLRKFYERFIREEPPMKTLSSSKTVISLEKVFPAAPRLYPGTLVFDNREDLEWFA